MLLKRAYCLTNSFHPGVLASQKERYVGTQREANTFKLWPR